MSSSRRGGRSALVALVLLSGAVITYACSDASVPTRIDLDGSAPKRAIIPQGQGLVAAYGFEESSGSSTIDASGNANTGTLGSGVTRTASGRFGAGLVFDNGMVTIANSSSLTLTNAMTLEAWVKPASVTSGWRDVIMKGNDNYYLMAMSANNALAAGGGIFAGESQTSKAFSASLLAANTWSHLAVTYDGAAVRLYVNGTQVSSIPRTGTIMASNDALQIGGDRFYGQYFQGIVDEVRVYNRALSATEVQADVSAPIGRDVSPPGPVSDTEPPNVTITTPTTAATYGTSSSKVSLSGTANDNIGVSAVTWSNSRGGSGSAAGTANWSASDLVLQSGENVLTVTARDTKGNSTIAKLTVTYTVPTPPTAGLVAAYGFGEGSGTAAADASGNSNIGALGMGVTRTPSGRFGSALLFKGDAMVTIPNSASLTLMSAMTLEAWVNPTSVTSAWRDVIIKGNDNYYLMATSSNKALVAGGGTFAGERRTTKTFSVSPLPTNAWTHIATTYDGATIRVYVNGAQVSSVARTGPITSSTHPLQVGGDPFYGQYFQGTIDEVRIYNRALSVAEIQSDMNTPVNGGQTPPQQPAPDTNAPKIAITSPTTAASYVTSASSLTLGGTVSDNVGVTQITWTNSRSGSGTATGASNWSVANIALQSGSNVLTVTARDAAGNAGTATVTVTYNPPTSPPATPTSLFIQTQPSSSVLSGVVLAQQPVIQLRDAANNAIPVAGVTVAATIASGGGSLGGTTLVATNASGVATFTNLQITGTAGTRTLMFSATGLTSLTSTAIAVSAPAGSASGSALGLYPNRPASFTQSSEIDFSQAIPSLPADVDRPISGASGWNMIYFGSNWSQTTNAGAPQSAPGVWQGRWAAGSYGGGVIGAGPGHGIGNVFTYGPGNVFLNNGTPRLYMSMRVYFDFDASQWHPISNKFVNLAGDHSQILVQLRESGGHWRHAEELGPPSFFVDGGTDAPGEDHIPGQIDNRPIPVRQWVQIEVLVDIPSRVFKVWQDGVLTTNATPTFASTKINTVGVYAFRGGGGETISTDLYYKYDHFYIAW